MLQSHLHSLIAKAHRYQSEPERFQLDGQDPLTITVHGANGDHTVVLTEGKLKCDCDGFLGRGEGICPHVLAVEHHFRDQVPANAVTWPFATSS
jgi:SWIM zinc finger